MFDSPIVDIALGLILFFLVLSLVCSAVQEWIASAVGLRSRNLRKGIENLIGADIAQSLYEHGQFKALYRQPGPLGLLRNAAGGRGVGPSYVEPKRFANVLIDVIDRGDAQQAGGARPNATAKTAADIENLLDRIEQPQVREALLSLLAAANGEIDEFRKELAAWFDDAMDRVSGWYARTVKFWLFAIATVVVVVLNADAIALGKKLWEDQALRSVLAAAAEQTVKSGDVPTYKNVQTDLARFPIGWQCERSNGWCVCEKFAGGRWIEIIVGWLITILACSLGAPFWFGLLRKVVELRGAGKSPAEKAAAAKG